MYLCVYKREGERRFPRILLQNSGLKFIVFVEMLKCSNVEMMLPYKIGRSRNVAAGLMAVLGGR